MPRSTDDRLMNLLKGAALHVNSIVPKVDVPHKVASYARVHDARQRKLNIPHFDGWEF